MTYTKKLAIIPTEDDKTVNTTVTELVGSGLSYVHPYEAPFDRWDVISTASGNLSIAHVTSTNERLAQLLLEEIATLTDWTQSELTIQIAMFDKFNYEPGGIEGRIEQACKDATNKFFAEHGMKRLEDGQVVRAQA